MRTSALITAALSVCLVPVYGRHAPPVFFVSGERFSFESRGGGPALRFGRGEVIAGDVSMRFGNGRAEPEPADPLPFHVNIIAGNNPAKWRTRIPAYGHIRYRAVYPGIDLVYHSDRGRLGSISSLSQELITAGFSFASDPHRLSVLVPMAICW